MTEYGKMTLEEYRDALASDSPTPGGGTAAAVALSQGAALTIMVCNLTEGKEKWKDGWAAADKSRSVAEPLLDKGHSLAALDAHAFDRVMAAYRLPKSTQDEVDTRNIAIETETMGAARVPMDTAEAAYSLLETLPDLAALGNANAVTDVGVAGLLVSAACKGALFNVEININSLPEDDHYVRIMKRQMDELRLKCRDTAREIMHSVHDRMQQ